MSTGLMRRKLPELFLEATMIFFAVVLALAAEEWRESRDRLELADRALYTVTATGPAGTAQVDLDLTVARPAALCTTTICPAEPPTSFQLSTCP